MRAASEGEGSKVCTSTPAGTMLSICTASPTASRARSAKTLVVASSRYVPSLAVGFAAEPQPAAASATQISAAMERTRRCISPPLSLAVATSAEELKPMRVDLEAGASRRLGRYRVDAAIVDLSDHATRRANKVMVV